MIALHIQHTLHALGIGEGRRVQENQIKSRAFGARLFQPVEAIGALQPMLRAVEAVQHQVLLCPLQIGVRQIHARRAACPSGRGEYRRAAGVAEQVQEIGAAGPAAQQFAHDSMIEEKPGIQVVAEIDPELESRFTDHVALCVLRAAVALLVLRAALLGLARA